MNSSVIIPANAYGSHDHYDKVSSHVIPAIIVKMHEAKVSGEKEVVLWGTGKCIRDFVYAEDVANCVPYFIENDCAGPINLSTGIGCSIKELAETVAEVVGFQGELCWKTDMPEGPLNKTFDNTKMKQLGLSCPTKLRDGLIKTYDWYLNNTIIKV